MSERNTFYFTFGIGSDNSDKYVKIKAGSTTDARAKMFKEFGAEWAFMYTFRMWNLKEGLNIAEKYGLTLLTEL